MSYSIQRQPKRHLRILGFAACLLLVTGSIFAYIQLSKQTPHAAKTSAVIKPASSQAAKQDVYTSAVGDYLFSGTVMLGRAVETVANGNLEQPFSGMSTLGTYDAHIGVLECPITNNSVSYQTEVEKLIFNCKPSWIPTLKEHFPILSLSSDHMNDMGPDGDAETVSRLQAAGVQIVGDFNPHLQKDSCKAVFLPVRLQKTSGQQDKVMLPIAMCSFNYKIIFSPQPGELESIQKWSSLMPVIALMNGGPEYQHTAGQSQIDVAHKMIDYGASLVVGNGTHWAQNTEVYKGKLIVYSMGNFIFDQLDKDGRLALNLLVNMKLTYNNNLAGWLDVGKNCQATPGDCFSMAQSKGLSKLQPVFNFGAVASYGGYRQVATKASASDQAYIEQRANWTQTEQQLQQSAN